MKSTPVLCPAMLALLINFILHQEYDLLVYVDLFCYDLLCLFPYCETNKIMELPFDTPWLIMIRNRNFLHEKFK